MNSKYFFIILLLLAGAVIFGFGAKKKQGSSIDRSPNQSNNTTLSTLTPQNKTMGVVEVTLTPENVEPGEEIVFDLAMNNHSIDLDYDYIKIVTLLDDQENEYKPSEWTGNTSGHHVSGKLKFSPIQTQTSSITLKIDGVDNQKETFEWKL